MQTKEAQTSFVIRSLSKIEDEQRFCMEICKILKEPKIHVIRTALKYMNKETALQILQETIEVQLSGGMEAFAETQRRISKDESFQEI